MYAMTGTLVSQAGQRDELAGNLTQAAQIVGRLPGCHLYVVSEALADDTTLCVIELWDDKDAHDAALQDPQVRALIQKAMPLMAEPPQGAELKVVGGHGLSYYADKGTD